MNSNTWFVFFALALAALVVAALIFVLLRSRTAPNQASQEKANARVYREQIADLDREHDSGHISQDEWQLSRDELSRRLLEDTAMVDDPLAKQEKPAMWTAVLIAMLLPLTAMGMYLWLGEPDGLNPQEVKAPAQADQHELDGMAKALAQKLESDGGNVQRWVMLARTYRTLGKFEESMRAYQRALKLSADDDIDLERIEVMAMQNNGNFEGEPWRVIREVLKKD
ncbi:MAG: c-type cytochrome biogenesis protein CcmI, partial [Betaproteobacteria bacterium]|nr:c-type cytochrome biogenesis protein CcmI [Betaproteobacteria bacterium]